MHTYMHPYMPTCMHASLHTCLHRYVHAYLAHTHTHTLARAHTHTIQRRVPVACLRLRLHRRRTPLHWAASYGKYDVVTLLVANRADASARDDGG